MSRPVYGLTRKIGIKISRRSLPLYEEKTRHSAVFLLFQLCPQELDLYL